MLPDSLSRPWWWNQSQRASYPTRDTIFAMEERRRTAFPGLDRLQERRRALLDELVAERHAAGLSQTELAARMGTSQSAIARLEGGELDARMSTLERYAAALEHTVDWQLRPRKESP